MVIWFKSDRAWNHLMKHGMVFTLRARRRKTLGTQKVKLRRDIPAVMEVEVEEWGHFRLPEDVRALEKYVWGSGFETVGEWLEEVRKLNRGRMPREVWMYAVWLPKLPSLNEWPVP